MARRPASGLGPCASAERGDACNLADEGGPPAFGEAVQLWGKESAPPGLGQAEVEAFIAAQTRDLRRACWDDRFGAWERAEIEWGVAVDPSGAVVPESEPSEPAAALERARTRVTSSDLARCVSRQVQAWTFPRATLPTWMLVRFSFAN
jgi:hypothetical protein